MNEQMIEYTVLSFTEVGYLVAAVVILALIAVAAPDIIKNWKDA